MKQCSFGRRGGIRVKLLLFALVIALISASFTGCSRPAASPAPAPARTENDRYQAIAAEPESLFVIPEGIEPCKVYSRISTIERVASLVLEGFTDESNIQRIADVIQENGAPCVMFFSGATAMDYPTAVQYVAGAGLEIGNYGITGQKNLHNNSAEKNHYQISKAQQLLTAALGKAPEKFRLNGTEYTDDILRVTAMCGLKAGVMPSEYINHRSFKSYGEACNYVQKMPRGSIITVKLGQELDLAEFGDRGEELDEKPAIDPEPNLSDNILELQNLSFTNVLNVVTWLLEALAEEGYTLLSLEELENANMPIAIDPRALTPEEEKLYDELSYTGITTDVPLGVPEGEAVSFSYFNDTVFVGDSCTVSLQDYVSYRRIADPFFMGNARFLTSIGLGVGNALWNISDESRHPEVNGVKVTVEDAIAGMNVKHVYIMLGINDLPSYSIEDYLDNLKVLIYLIRQKTPGVTVTIQSILPGIEGRTNEPSNVKIFRYNLALAKFCAQYGFDYVDVAFSIRDERGYMPLEMCSDPDRMGIHLNDLGCAAWVDSLLTHAPARDNIDET